MTREKLSEADIALLVLDGSEPLDPLDHVVLKEASPQVRLTILNKSDLPQTVTPQMIKDQFAVEEIVAVSALYGHGIEELKERIHRAILGNALRPAGEILILNVRHKVAIEDAREALKTTLDGIRRGAPPECIAFDLRAALGHLERVVGGQLSEEVLDTIFSRFCIGK
jgi:tRNA modification GTPase